MQTNLKAQGYEVLVTGDGQTAIEYAAGREPDLIVLDSDMPGLDGYKVCECIRQFSTVPIVMLVSSTSSAHRVKGLYVGADQCMTKPFYTPELLARIQAVLRRVEIFEQKGYYSVFQTADSLDDSDQRLFVQD